jgi:hypothetical protein
VILYLLDEDTRAIALGRDFLSLASDVVFCYLRFPSGRIAHMHLVARSLKMRKMTSSAREMGG